MTGVEILLEELTFDVTIRYLRVLQFKDVLHKKTCSNLKSCDI